MSCKRERPGTTGRGGDREPHDRVLKGTKDSPRGKMKLRCRKKHSSEVFSKRVITEMKHTWIPSKEKKSKQSKENSRQQKNILKQIPARRRGRNSQWPRHCIDFWNLETRSDVLDSTDVHIVAKGGSFKPLVSIELRSLWQSVLTAIQTSLLHLRAKCAKCACLFLKDCQLRPALSQRAFKISSSACLVRSRHVKMNGGKRQFLFWTSCQVHSHSRFISLSGWKATNQQIS